ncbi:MAG: ankyrin repeat domain-containing protein, partial [Longimicrobiales bacterium]
MTNRLNLNAWLAVGLVALGLTAGAPETPVADAAQRGDAPEVKRLVDAGADVDGAQGDGMTGLHWAASNGDVEVLRILLESGADLEAGTRLGGHTPLHIASRVGHGDIVGQLVEAGADVGARTTTGATALHFAASSDNETALSALIEGGAEVDAREPQWEQTPLMFAGALGRAAAISILLEHGADASATAKVMDLIERDVMDRKDARQRQLEIAAIRSGEPLPVAPEPTPGEAGPSRENQGRDAEREAQEAQQRTGEPIPLNYAGLVRTHGGLSALHLAAREGHVDAVMTMLASGVDIDIRSAADESTPILVAAINGHFDLVGRLMDEGADIGLASDAGATVLYAVLNMNWAPKARHPQPLAYQQQQLDYLTLMEMLLDAGADVNARLTRTLWYTTYNRDLLGVDRTGATPFWRAAHATDVPAMKLLLEHGADPTLATIKVPRRRFGPRDT